MRDFVDDGNKNPFTPCLHKFRYPIISIVISDLRSWKLLKWTISSFFVQLMGIFVSGFCFVSSLKRNGVSMFMDVIDTIKRRSLGKCTVLTRMALGDDCENTIELNKVLQSRYSFFLSLSLLFFLFLLLLLFCYESELKHACGKMSSDYVYQNP